MRIGREILGLGCLTAACSQGTRVKIEGRAWRASVSAPERAEVVVRPGGSELPEEASRSEGTPTSSPARMEATPSPSPVFRPAIPFTAAWAFALKREPAFDAYRGTVLAAWQKQKEEVQRLIGNSDWNPNELYKAQTLMHNVFRFATVLSHQGDTALLDDLLSSIRLSFSHLTVRGAGDRRWICQQPTGSSTPCQHWNQYPPRYPYRNEEVFLCSVQWIFQVANALAAIAEVPQEKRTPTMVAFVPAAVGVVREHLFRWLRAVPEPAHPWSDPDYRKRLQILVDTKPLSTSLTISPGTASLLPDPMVHDWDLYLVGIAADVLTAHHASQDLKMLLAPTEVEFLEAVVRKGGDLLERHLVTSPRGNPAGLVWNAYEWDRYTDLRYAGYVGPLPTAATPVFQVSGVGEDISHGRRIPQLMWSLHRHLEAREARMGSALWKGFALQMAANVAYKHDGKIAFRNFLGGVDGWYRVGYFNGISASGGTAPSGLSHSAIDGGFGFMTYFSKEWRDLLREIYDSKDKESMRDHFRAYLWDSESPSTTLMAIPSFAPLFLKDSPQVRE